MIDLTEEEAKLLASAARVHAQTLVHDPHYKGRGFELTAHKLIELAERLEA